MFFEVNLVVIKACLLASLYSFFILRINIHYKTILTFIFLIFSLYLGNRTLFCVIFVTFILVYPLPSIRPNKKIIFLLGLIALFTFLILINKNSVLGRIFIWKIIIINLYRVPLLGYGYNTFKFYYSEWQSEYFLTNQDWSIYHYLSDAPSFAFNEILHFYIEWGLFGVFFLLILICFNVVLLKNNSKPILNSFILSNIYIFIFSMVSYPLHNIWIIFILVCNHVLIISIHYKKVLFGAGILSVILFGIFQKQIRYNRSIHNWQYAMSFPINSGSDKDNIFNSEIINLSSNQYFLKSYCDYLLNEKKYNEVLDLGSRFIFNFNQYEYNLLMGSAYLQKGNFELSKNYYIKSHHLIPNRFLPLYFLMQSAILSDDLNSSKHYAQKILNTPIKIQSPLIKRIKGDAALILK